MNGDEKLPSEHFWDTEEAEKKYYGVGQSIVEAEEKLTEAQSRLLSVQAVYERFAGGASAVVRRYYSDTEESVLHNLNHTLNPYWLPSDGQVESDKPFNPGRGTLIVQKVESETVQAEIIFGRMRKGYHRDYRIRYSYEKRVEWYTPTGEAGMSSLEHSLRDNLSPLTPPNVLCDKVLYDKLMEELIREVLVFTTPLVQQVVLKFIPDLAPTNTEEIYLSYGDYKEDVPKLDWPPLVGYRRPEVGEQFGLTSYKDIRCWLRYGRWEAYQFPLAELKTVWERLERIADRLRERIADAAKEVLCCEEKIMLLRRKKDKVRILHYKPLIYKEYWSAMQTTG